MRSSVICTAVVVLLALAGTATAQTLSIRLDPAAITSVAATRAAVIDPDGYEVAYEFVSPHQQEFTFSCRTCGDDGFVLARVVLLGAEVAEIISRRPLDPASLTIRQGVAGPVATWDVDIGRDRVPPPPPPEEIRARQATVAALLARAQEVLGVRGYTGAPAALTLRLREGAGLALEVDEGEIADKYVFHELGRPEMTEILESVRPHVRWRAEVQAGKLLLERWTTGADTNVWTTLEVAEDAWWGGEVETTIFPGGQRVVRPMEITEARELLSDALRELGRARARFGLTLGRDLSVFRLP
jgi:hypothetical protein